MPKKNVAEEEERDGCFCVRDGGRVRQRGVLVIADHGDDQVAEALAGGRVYHFAPGPALHVWDAGE